MKTKLIMLGYILVLSMFFGCSNMFNIPRIHLSEWKGLKPLEVTITHLDKCYSSKLVFVEDGYTIFENIQAVKCGDSISDANICISQSAFEKKLQWNLFYLAERIKDCK